MSALVRWLDAPTWSRTFVLAAAIAFGLLTKFSFPLYFAIGAIVLMVARRKFPLLRGVIAHVIAFAIVYAFYETANAGPRFLDGLATVAHNTRHAPSVFFRGEIGNGWWSYFPTLLAIKTPIALLLLAAAGAWRILKNREHRALVVVAVGIVLACMTSNLNYGVRHVLPLYVLLVIIAAYAIIDLWPTRGRFATVLLAAWLVVGSALAHPDYLPWMNALAGEHPERIVVDSSLDWGQDVLRLSHAARKHDIDRLGVLLFGTTDLRRIGLPPTHPIDPFRPAPGWYAVSETELAMTQARDPQAYAWLTNDRPFHRIGHSIRLYSVAR
jgi:hypothetical protein